MGRLLVVETRRFLARRLVRIAFGLILVAILISGVVAFLNSHRPSAEQLADAQRQRTESVAACTDGEFGIPPEEVPPGQTLEQYCEQIVQPAEAFIADSPFRLAGMQDVFWAQVSWPCWSPGCWARRSWRRVARRDDRHAAHLGAPPDPGHRRQGRRGRRRRVRPHRGRRGAARPGGVAGRSGSGEHRRRRRRVVSGKRPAWSGGGGGLAAMGAGIGSRSPCWPEKRRPRSGSASATWWCSR